jgi:hypothetical protein
MNRQRGALPTLTEVIEIHVDPQRVEAPPPPFVPESMPIELLPVARVDAHAALTSQVLETLRPRIDALLNARLREVLAPHRPRLTDEAVQRMRSELVTTMQVLVAHAIDDVLARRRKP